MELNQNVQLETGEILKLHWTLDDDPILPSFAWEQWLQLPNTDHTTARPREFCIRWCLTFWICGFRPIDWSCTLWMKIVAFAEMVSCLLKICQRFFRWLILYLLLLTVVWRHLPPRSLRTFVLDLALMMYQWNQIDCWYAGWTSSSWSHVGFWL